MKIKIKSNQLMLEGQFRVIAVIEYDYLILIDKYGYLIPSALCCVVDTTFDSHWEIDQNHFPKNEIIPLERVSDNQMMLLQKWYHIRKDELKREIDAALGSIYQEEYTQLWYRERKADLNLLELFYKTYYP